MRIKKGLKTQGLLALGFKKRGPKPSLWYSKNYQNF